MPIWFMMLEVIKCADWIKLKEIKIIKLMYEWVVFILLKWVGQKWTENKVIVVT